MTPRIAMVCSGLGHIQRGNETWARTVADGLYRHETAVTLFGGGPRPEADCPYARIPNWPRDFWLTRHWLPWHRRYRWEQLSFLFFLQSRLRRETFDIVQCADPDLALQLHRRAAPLGIRVIYKDGLLLGPPWCRKFDFVQVLAPYYREVAAAQGGDTRNWFVIPHLVDTDRFAPAQDRARVRAKRLGPDLADDTFVVLAVGDFSPASNKRLDWIVGEFARLPAVPPARLLLAGQASPRDFRKFESRTRSQLGRRVHLFSNLSQNDMIEIYQLADVFAHAAVREPFGIVFLEAMASGLPIVGHHFEVTRWIVGDAGQIVDMNVAGQLADALAALQQDRARKRQISEQARRRALNVFAREKIVPLYRRMYQQVMAVPRPVAGL